MSVLKEAPVVSSSINTFKCPAPKKLKNNVAVSSPPEETKNSKSPLEINAHHQSHQQKPKPSPKHVRDFNDIFSCYLCHGYLINATTIDNCLHSFCRSCIVNYLLSSKNNHCPKCGNVEKSINLSNLRKDEQLQSVVYKIVPDLYKKEMDRQEHFHNGHNSVDPFVYDNKFFSSRDPISLSLEYYTGTTTAAIAMKEGKNDIPPIKYLQCPAAVTVHHLQKFLCSKYNIDLDNEKLTIDIIYEEEILPTTFMLMDVAYTFNWKRCAPLRLFYRILIKNLCNKLETKVEQTNVEEQREEENVVPKKIDLVVKAVRFKDEDSKTASNILKSRKNIKVFQNNNNSITSIKTVTSTSSPSKQNVLMATFGRKKEVKVNKPNNVYTTTFVKDFKSLRSNDICKPVEKNSLPSNMKPMVSIPQIEVERALKHTNAASKIKIKEEKPIDIPRIKICVPKPVKEEPIDTKRFRKLSIDERPVHESVDQETYVRKIGLQPIDKKTKLSPDTSPSSSSSSASSVTSSFNFNNNKNSEQHRHSLSSSTSSSSSSHKKRKKSKHSKEFKDKDSSSSKKRKIHAEISSSNENLKLKVKINHHNHKEKTSKSSDSSILAPAQLSPSTIEKIRSEPLALPTPPAPIPVKPVPPITAIKLKDTSLPISPPLPPSLFKTVPHTIQTVTATSTLSPIPTPTQMNTVNRSNVKQITNINNKEKFTIPSPPKSSLSSGNVPLKITSIASEANRQATLKRSISADETLENTKKMAKMPSDDGKQVRRISFGSLATPNSNSSSKTNNKIIDDLKKSLTQSEDKIPQPSNVSNVSPTKATRPPPPTIPLLKIKRSLQPNSTSSNNNEPPGLISMKNMKNIGMVPIPIINNLNLKRQSVPSNNKPVSPDLKSNKNVVAPTNKVSLPTQKPVSTIKPIPTKDQITTNSNKDITKDVVSSNNNNKIIGKESLNSVLDLSRSTVKSDTKNSIEDALKKIRQNNNYSSVSSTSSAAVNLKSIKPENKLQIQSQRILPNLPKLNEISKIRPQNSSIRSIPNPSALIRNIQEVPALATISPTPNPLPITNGTEIKVEKVTSNGRDTSEAVVSSSTVSTQNSTSATDDEKKMKKNLNLEILADKLNMRAAAQADSKLSPKGNNNYVVSTSTAVVSSTEATGSANKTTSSGSFNISSLVATAASPKSV